MQNGPLDRSIFPAGLHLQIVLVVLVAVPCDINENSLAPVGVRQFFVCVLADVENTLLPRTFLDEHDGYTTNRLDPFRELLSFSSH